MQLNKIISLDIIHMNYSTPLVELVFWVYTGKDQRNKFFKPQGTYKTHFQTKATKKAPPNESAGPFRTTTGS